MNKYKTLIKDTALFGISDFASKFITFFLLPLYTNILSTTEYGQVDLLNNMVNLIYPLLTLAIVEATIRFALDANENNNKVLSTALLFIFSMLDEELSLCDIAVVVLPLTDTTKNIINAVRLNSMKNGAVLVNIARGGLVDEKALIEALNKNLFGAVLDVFEEEPLSSNNALWNQSNVIISPHNSFVSEGNKSRLWDCIYNNLKEFAVNYNLR